MATDDLETTPYWSSTATFPRFGKLTEDIAADVVVIGAGVTGLTTAYLLAKSGKQVVVLERGRCAAIDTGHTSAHLTMVTDTRLGDLVKRFGPAHAQATWDAGLAAIATVDETIREHDIDAEFEWVDGYLHVPLSEKDVAPEAERLKADASLAREFGFDNEYLDGVPLVDRPGIRFPNQARIQPRAYLAGVAKACVALGGRIYEHSAAEQFCEKPRGIKAGGHMVRCHDVVIATHNPLLGFAGMAGATLFQTKLALYTSYVVAGRVPKGVVPDALWWDTGERYDYLRVESHRDYDVVIFGGEDHKTGQQDDTRACYQRLEKRVAALVPSIDFTHRWSGQVIETPDGLPYVGQNADRQYAASGYAGNGLTFGTLAGMVVSDAILRRPNPWAELLDPARKALTRGLWDYLKENLDYPYYMMRDRFAGPDALSLRAVKRGQGRIIERDGAKVAAYRDAAGTATLRSAVCTHMGCTVGWNTAERTWDCPCHGSRFKPSGEVISGPAEASLPEPE